MRLLKLSGAAQEVGEPKMLRYKVVVKTSDVKGAGASAICGSFGTFRTCGSQNKALRSRRPVSLPARRSRTKTFCLAHTGTDANVTLQMFGEFNGKKYQSPQLKLENSASEYHIAFPCSPSRLRCVPLPSPQFPRPEYGARSGRPYSTLPRPRLLGS